MSIRNSIGIQRYFRYLLGHWCCLASFASFFVACFLHAKTNVACSNACKDCPIAHDVLSRWISVLAALVDFQLYWSLQYAWISCQTGLLVCIQFIELFHFHYANSHWLYYHAGTFDSGTAINFQTFYCFVMVFALVRHNLLNTHTKRTPFNLVKFPKSA